MGEQVKTAPANGSAKEDPAGNPPAGSALTEQLVRLQALGTEELRAEWRRLYRAQPPRLSPDLMRRALAYRMQELACGGLTKSIERRLVALADHAAEGKPSSAAPTPRLSPGDRLVREWGGRTFAVTVTEAGFLLDGKRYGSLTQIAREITGAHWSGPRFFGLTKRCEARSPQSAGEVRP